ncbi:hypothetical protein GCM10023166_07560 [Paeniglutamicibacter cryotolerans]
MNSTPITSPGASPSAVSPDPSGLFKDSRPPFGVPIPGETPDAGSGVEIGTADCVESVALACGGDPALHLASKKPLPAAKTTAHDGPGERDRIDDAPSPPLSLLTACICPRDTN